MYPLNAILIGRDESLLPHVRRELMNCSSQLEAEYPPTSKAPSSHCERPSPKSGS